MLGSWEVWGGGGSGQRLVGLNGEHQQSLLAQLGPKEEVPEGQIESSAAWERRPGGGVPTPREAAEGLRGGGNLKSSRDNSLNTGSVRVPLQLLPLGMLGQRVSVSSLCFSVVCLHFFCSLDCAM